jgi:hypothetical protein
MNKVKLPYGVSNFARVAQNYYFVDKTKYIETLENMSEPYIFFLRPRRFGKSLFVSMLGYYYGLEHKDKFNALFGKYYIGLNPTPQANSYFVLTFDFSRILTDTMETTLRGFNTNVFAGIQNFNSRYNLFETEKLNQIRLRNTPNEMIIDFFETFYQAVNNRSIYLLVDEYDHFANELIAFNFDGFANIVSKNGFVRKFYEAIKTATGQGIIEKLFATGVTPITLDSMTSGFNIATNITRDEDFNEMMGFTENEVLTLVDEICKFCRQCDKTQIIKDMRDWYNGYLFHYAAKERIYNPDMALYFTKSMRKKDECSYPEDMLDTNIASDYGKVKSLINIKNREQNVKIIETLVQVGELESEITRQYSFEKDFDTQDFVSLLYYLGMVTIKEKSYNVQKLTFPNYVIKGLYLQNFLKIIETENNIQFNILDLYKATTELTMKSNLFPFLNLIEQVLKNISNRDAMRLSEKHVKILFVGYAMLMNVYYVKSEYEVERNYPDIMFLYRKPYKPPYQYVFELKYLKKAERSKLETVKLAALEQMSRYLKTEEIKIKENLRAFVIVIVGDKFEVVEEIGLTKPSN